MSKLGNAPGQEVAHFRVTSALDAITLAVHKDELCYVLAEDNLMSQSGQRNRYQILRVVRSDRLSTAYVCMGPTSAFPMDQKPIFLYGGWVTNGKGKAWHTVGELMEQADELRAKRFQSDLEPTDIWGNFLKQAEEQQRRKTNISTFGSGGKLVRG